MGKNGRSKAGTAGMVPFCAATEAEIDQVLARPWHTIKLDFGLEAVFENATASKRRCHILTLFVVFFIISIGGLFLDSIFGILWIGVFLRLGCFVSCLIVSALILLRPVKVWIQGVASGLPICALITTTTILGKCSTHTHSDRYVMSAGMLMSTINLMGVLRVQHALPLALLNIAAYAGTALLVQGQLAAGEIADMVAVLCVPTLLSLRHALRFDRNQKDAFLLELRSRRQADALKVANARLKSASMVDPLTGLSNRRAFEATLTSVWQLANLQKRWLGILMIDVDHFKAYNDALGHLAGDAALRAVARAIGIEASGADELAARFGGEEFVVVLPYADVGATLALGERIRRAVENLRWPHPGLGANAIVTISVGAAALSPSAGDAKAEMLLGAADAALYEAKRLGRNRVAASASGMTCATASAAA